MNEVMTEPEAAKFLRMGLSTLRALRRAKQVPHLSGKPARYLRSSLLSWLQGQEIQPTTTPTKAPKRSTIYKINNDKVALKSAVLT
tara:strand:- start:2632 stop:2889 length:258 start_codon:yes stop_codon:yes gene_type:complete